MRIRTPSSNYSCIEDMHTKVIECAVTSERIVFS